MTGVCCHFLLQCIFPIQVWNLCLLQVCCIDRQILYHLATEKALEGGRGSNNGRHCKQRAWEKHTMQRLISLRASLLETWKWKSLSHVWLFVTPWTSPGQNTGVGSLSLLQGGLPNPGIEPRSPTLWADCLPAESQGKPKNAGMGSLSLLQQILRAQE